MCEFTDAVAADARAISATNLAIRTARDLSNQAQKIQQDLLDPVKVANLKRKLETRRRGNDSKPTHL